MNQLGLHRCHYPALAKTLFASLVLSAAISAYAMAADPASTKGPAAVDGARISAADSEPGNWMTTGRTYDEQRFSPLKKINDGNVDKLGLTWSYKLDIDRGVEATPIVVDGVMYTTGPFSIVYALDARDGKLLWKYDPQSDRSRAGEACCDAVNRGVAVWNGKVYVGVLDGRLEAIDAKTGQKVWSVDTRTDPSRSITITGAPRIVKGKVIIGNGGAEFGVRGYITAYDAETGKQDWRFFTVPGDPKEMPKGKGMEIAAKTWFGDNYHKQGGGGTVWDSMSYDPELNLLYIGVGNGSSWNPRIRSEGKGDNLFLSSIVAINPDNGEYVWHYQTTPGDAWDYTATQHIMLVDLELNGKKRKVLMQAPKNGFFYVIDRATGELLSAKNFIPINWATGIDMKTGRPIRNEKVSDYWKDPEKKARLIQPAFWGAHDWQPMSYNPQTGLVYIPAHIMSAMYQDVDGAPPRSKFKSIYQLDVNTGMMPEDPEGLRKIADTWTGKLIAWDPIKQEVRWEQPYSTIFNGGTLSTAGNLVFEGTAVAYAADTGKKLWESPANTGVMAAPIAYEVDGEQYVTFMAGWGGAFSTFAGALSLRAGVKPNAQVLTYKLGGTAKLPALNDRFADRKPEPPELTGTTAQIDQGRELFNGSCSQCHGINAISGGVVPDLRTLSKENHQRFLGILYGARIPDGMPSFQGHLDMQQAEAVHQYLIKRAIDLQEQLAGTKKTASN